MARKKVRPFLSPKILFVLLGLVALFVFLYKVTLNRGYFFQKTAETPVSDVEAAAPASMRDRFHIRRTASAGTPDILAAPTFKFSYQCKNTLMSTATPPLVAGNTVYFMCSGGGDTSSAPGQGIYAFDMTTGAQKWRNPGCNGAAASTISQARMEVIGDSTMYTNFCGKLTSLNTKRIDSMATVVSDGIRFK